MRIGMAEYLSPGVYVEEFDAGSKPMEGVGTSTAGFIGLAQRGITVGVPQLVTGFADFKRIYGGYLSENEFGTYRFLAYAVEHFFINGGSRCYVMRVAPQDAAPAEGALPSQESAVLKITAKNPGAWGNQMQVMITPAGKAKTQILEIVTEQGKKRYRVKKAAGFQVGDIVVLRDGKADTEIFNQITKSQGNFLEFAEEFDDSVVDTELLPEKTLSTCEFNLEVRFEDVVEGYENLSFNVESSGYVVKRTEKSDLILVEHFPQEGDTVVPPMEQIAGEKDRDSVRMAFQGGSNGSVSSLSAADFIGEDNGAGKRTGIQSFVDNDNVSIMAVPGVTDPNVQLSLVAHCELLASRFAVLDVPRDCAAVQDIIAHRDLFDSNYAALYHPWLTVFDPLDKRNLAIPPSGSVMGIYARSDNERGVHKAPANEVVRNCVGLDYNYNKGEQDILNPKGVNLIRVFSGMGIRVWGARTASSDGSWKYVNVRRLFIFIEESIRVNTNWVVFEPNDETLWVRVKRTIEVFLTGLWRNGSLAGASTNEAFFVNVGQSTMTQDDIDNGRLICVIGAAPVKPAEFVIFRIAQKTGDAQ